MNDQESVSLILDVLRKGPKIRSQKEICGNKRQSKEKNSHSSLENPQRLYVKQKKTNGFRCQLDCWFC